MTDIPNNLKKPLANLLLALADDKLMLGHRNSDWTGLGPILEEDIAFSHMAQDEMAHAQAIYQFVAELMGGGKTADELAFGRPPHEYLCAHIVEVPDEFDWATAMLRKFFCDHFDLLRLNALAKSSHKPLADLARRIAAEEQLHVEHVDSWMKRLGRGGDEARTRIERAWFEGIFGESGSLFETTEGEQLLVTAGVIPHSFKSFFDEWAKTLNDVLQSANLPAEAHDALKLTRFPGGRHGVHTPHFKELLDEMCEVYRIEPGAAW